MTYRTHNPYEESHWVSRLRENLTSGSDGEGLETGLLVPRQSFTRQTFFKWIKQHLKIKSYWGRSPNAVKTQIWIAISVYVIVLILKKKLNLTQSIYEILQILSINIFDKEPLYELFIKSNLQYFKE
jgi:hypothetical protein